MTDIERWRIRNVGNGPLIAEPVGFGRHHRHPVLGSGFEVVPSDAYQGAVAEIERLKGLLAVVAEAPSAEPKTE